MGIYVTLTGQLCVSSVASAKPQIKLLSRLIYNNIQYVERLSA
jgi:hypothetical protein